MANFIDELLAYPDYKHSDMKVLDIGHASFCVTRLLAKFLSDVNPRGGGQTCPDLMVLLLCINET